jgi:hypothetical protein
MAHGTRSRAWRVAVAGAGALLCGGLVGCMNTDKQKDAKVPTKPGIGLPGTPTLPSGTGTGTATKTGAPTGTAAPGAFAGAGANLQPQQRIGTTGQNTNTGGGTIQPAGFAAPAGPQPGFGGGISPPTPPSGALPGGPVPAPTMSMPKWDTNYQPIGSGPTNPALPPMTDIAPIAPPGAPIGPGASVLPPQPPAGAPGSLGPVAPLP